MRVCTQPLFWKSFDKINNTVVWLLYLCYLQVPKKYEKPYSAIKNKDRRVFSGGWSLISYN